MSRETQWVLVIVFWVGFFAYRRFKRAKHPERLVELQEALRLHAELALHRNRDAESSKELRTLAEHLGYAQMLANGGAVQVAREWPGLQYSLRRAIDPSTLARVNLTYTDRCEEIKAAVFDLEARLMKKAAQAS